MMTVIIDERFPRDWITCDRCTADYIKLREVVSRQTSFVLTQPYYSIDLTRYSHAIGVSDVRKH